MPVSFPRPDRTSCWNQLDLLSSQPAACTRPWPRWVAPRTRPGGCPRGRSATVKAIRGHAAACWVDGGQERFNWHHRHRQATHNRLRLGSGSSVVCSLASRTFCPTSGSCPAPWCDFVNATRSRGGVMETRHPSSHAPCATTPARSPVIPGRQGRPLLGAWHARRPGPCNLIARTTQTLPEMVRLD